MLSDALLHNLFAYLDYTTRINLNSALPQNKRFQKQLNPNIVRQVELLLNVTNLKKGIHNMESLRGEPRRDAFLNYFHHILPKNLMICQHNKNFREAVINKLQIYKDINCPEYVNSDDSLMDSLIPLCKGLEYKIKSKYPYLYALTLPTNDINWSPVDYIPAVTLEAPPMKIVKKRTV